MSGASGGESSPAGRGDSWSVTAGLDVGDELLVDELVLERLPPNEAVPAVDLFRSLDSLDEMTAVLRPVVPRSEVLGRHRVRESGEDDVAGEVVADEGADLTLGVEECQDVGDVASRSERRGTFAASEEWRSGRGRRGCELEHLVKRSAVGRERRRREERHRRRVSNSDRAGRPSPARAGIRGGRKSWRRADVRRDSREEVHEASVRLEFAEGAEPEVEETARVRARRELREVEEERPSKDFVAVVGVRSTKADADRHFEVSAAIVDWSCRCRRAVCPIGRWLRRIDS